MSDRTRGNAITVAAKEVASFFSSPLAFVFLLVFLLVNLMTFFDGFFARNIADVRPLFEWMPLLLIFLIAALTMRMWSEETRAGTLEFLLTLPVPTWRLVWGKFLACLFLVVLALVLTIPIAIAVSLMGDLDWGPVFGGYLAAVFLASFYISVGLFVSSRTNNQVVSLILTTLVCSVFYLLGSSFVSKLPWVGNRAMEVAELMASGSRFSSITRGVIDIRDIYYYLSLCGVFIALNIYSLERLKWSAEPASVPRGQHRRWKAFTALVALNFLAANFWLNSVNSVRIDTTEQKLYSISPATRSFVQQLQEPLLIRGYFSSKTHPLLAPLVPQLRDLIREYEVVGKGKIEAEFIDPRQEPELEEEANQKYNIKPVPFQIADRYESALVNSYFNVLIKYGDKYEVLGFQDLIEVKMKGEMGLDVKLRNPEYDITRSIKKVLYGFQGIDNLFAAISKPVEFVGYYSSDEKLPEQIREFKTQMATVLEDVKKEAAGKLVVRIEDTDQNDGSVAKTIQQQFGFQPMVAGFLDPEPFFFYMTLQSGDKVVQLSLPQDFTEESAKKLLESGLKRFSTGFMKTVGVVKPEEQTPSQPWMQQQRPEGKQFSLVSQKLSEGYSLRDADLKDGYVPEEVDLLMVLSPKDLDEKQLFAIDQFLMKGGTVVVSTSPYELERSQSGLSAKKIHSGLEDWLKAQGINIESKMVLDPQNEKYPVPVVRQVGAFRVQELKNIEYPFFVDIRSAGMNQDNGITSGLPQVTLNWASPISFDSEKNQGRKIVELLKSSDSAWTSSATNVLPNFNSYPELGFPQSEERGSQVMAAVVEGNFTSFFKGKKSPLLTQEDEKAEKEDGSSEESEGEKEDLVLSSVIEKSPASARLIIFATNEFLADQTLRTSASSGTNRYLNSLQLVENSLDWSLEDRALLSIRGRGHFSRTLPDMELGEYVNWEIGSYIASLVALLAVYVVYRVLRSSKRKANLKMLGY